MVVERACPKKLFVSLLYLVSIKKLSKTRITFIARFSVFFLIKIPALLASLTLSRF